MKNINAVITGLGGYLPENVMTNQDFEKLVDTTDEWITTRTGIKERHILEKEKGASYMAVQAVNEALKKANTLPEEIEAVILSTTTSDYVFPSTASIVSYECGMNNAFGYDIQAACAGFLFALSQGAAFLKSGMYKKIMIVSAEKMSSIVDYEDRSTCPLFGDGAAAVVLEAQESDEQIGFIDSFMRTDGSGKEHLIMKAGGCVNPASAETVAKREHFVYQEGKPVFKNAVKDMTSSSLTIMERNNLTGDDVDWLIPHQANLRIIDSVTRSAKINPDKVLRNIEKVGNTSSASIPLCLWQNQDKFKKGDNIVMTAFGAGFSWAAGYIIWGY